jgi:hypothetical protein
MAPFEVGLITIWDDAVAVHQPDILVKAKAVELAKNQGVFWNALRSPSVAIIQKSFQIYGRSLTTLNATIGTGAGVGWVDGAATADLLKPLTFPQLLLMYGLVEQAELLGRHM